MSAWRGVAEGGEIGRLMWAGDVAALQRRYPCRCCCAEHTFPRCPARLWWGCVGRDDGVTAEDEESWVRCYMLGRGMTRERFYG